MPEKPLVEAIKAIMAEEGLDEQQKSERIFGLVEADRVTEIERLKAALQTVSADLEYREARSTAELEVDRLKSELANIRYQRTREAILEMYKLSFEAYKNQTVLSSGAVVAFTAITAGVLPEPSFLWVLVLSYVCMLGSIIATAWAMQVTAIQVGAALMPNRLQQNGYSVSKTTSYLSWGGFVLSLVLFLGFVTVNLLP